jgi:putative membrane protein
VSNAQSESEPGQPPEPTHPDYRFSLANERTFLAWVRTTLAFVAAGIGVVNLPLAFGSETTRRVLGVLLLALGLVAAGAALMRWRANQRAIELGQPLPVSFEMAIIGGGLVVAAMVALVAVIVNF